jgi:hypothetical protein
MFNTLFVEHLAARRCSQHVRFPIAPGVRAAIPGAVIRRAPLPLQVLFDGRSELDQISRIFSLLGSPNEKIWPGLSKLPAASKVGHPGCAAATKPATSFGDGVGVPKFAL